MYLAILGRILRFPSWLIPSFLCTEDYGRWPHPCDARVSACVHGASLGDTCARSTVLHEDEINDLIEKSFRVKSVTNECPRCLSMGVSSKEKAANNARCSQAVTHPSTNLKQPPAQRCLTSVIGREPVFSTWYGRWQTVLSVHNTFTEMGGACC